MQWKGGRALHPLPVVIALLCLVALAPGAQASGEFRYEGQTFGELELTEEGVTGSIAPGAVLFEQGFGVSCEGGTVDATIHVGGTVAAHARFVGCEVPHSFCTINDEEEEEGEGVINANAEGELLLHEGQHYVVFSSTEKEPTAIIHFEGIFCGLGSYYPLSGSVAVNLTTALSESAVQHTASLTETSQKLLGAKFVLGYSSGVTVDGGLAELTVTEEGAWGAE